MAERLCPPTLRVAEHYDRTFGGLACDIMALLDMPPDVNQRAVMDDWLAVDGRGTYVHRRNFLEAPRQNIKSFLLCARTIYGAMVRGERVLFTAHNYDTTAEMRDFLYGIFGAKPNDEKAQYPWVNKRVSRVSHTNGHEAIYLKNGGRVLFSTRTKSAKRGFTVDVVIFDEAQELREEQVKALVSTAAAGPKRNPQYIFAGTPPTPECYGDVFQIKRDEIVSGADSDRDMGAVSLNEWSASDIPGFTLDDVANREVWYATNLALGTRITEGAVEAEFGTFTEPLSFAQERLGYWVPRTQLNNIIKPEKWAACANDSPPKDGNVSFGVKFSKDGRLCVISACIRPKGGTPHVETAKVVSMDDGVGPVARMLAAKSAETAKLAIDGKAWTQALVSELYALRYPRYIICATSTAEMAQACQTLVSAVNSEPPAITHYGQSDLTRSATCCQKRDIGTNGAWAFESFGDADATFVESAALAYMAAMTAKRDPSKIKK